MNRKVVIYNVNLRDIARNMFECCFDITMEDDECMPSFSIIDCIKGTQNLTQAFVDGYTPMLVPDLMGQIEHNAGYRGPNTANADPQEFIIIVWHNDKVYHTISSKDINW